MDESGKLVDTEALLQQKGLVVGVYCAKAVEPTDARPNPSKEYGIIQAVEQGSVLLYMIGEGKKESKRIDPKAFLEEWSPVMDAAEVADSGAVTAMPLLGPCNDKDFLLAMAKNKFQHALYLLWSHVNQASHSWTIVVNTKPRKHVVALRDIAKEELIMIPFSTSLAWSVEGECKTKEAIAVSSYHHPFMGDQVLHICPFFSLPSATKPTTGKAVEFWAVERYPTANGGDVSVPEGMFEMTMSTITVSTATVIPTRVRGLAAAHNQERITLPLLVNSEDISKGQRLFWRDPLLKKTEKPIKAVKASRSALASLDEDKPKKQKVAAAVVGPESTSTSAPSQSHT